MTLTLRLGFYYYYFVWYYYTFFLWLKVIYLFFSHTRRSLSIKFSILYADIIKLYSKSWTKWKWKEKKKKNEIMFYYLITPLILCLTANNPNITKEWWCHISSGKSSTKIAKFFLTNRRKIIKLGKVYTQLNTFIFLLRVNFFFFFFVGNFIIIKNKDILMLDYIEKLWNNFNSKKKKK